MFEKILNFFVSFFKISIIAASIFTALGVVLIIAIFAVLF